MGSICVAARAETARGLPPCPRSRSAVVKATLSRTYRGAASSAATPPPSRQARRARRATAWACGRSACTRTQPGGAAMLAA
ncbi:Uncharacterised protein [Bordetella pertussis]|nr:Uncharacterised protein [Bordetella pertussis]